MYGSSCKNYVRSENPVYRWGYLMKSTSPRIRKFNFMARNGVSQSDWVGSGARSQPIAPLAPPQVGHGV